MPLFETVHDLAVDSDRIRKRRYGMIETAAGKFQCLRLRPYPKLLSLPEIVPAGEWLTRRAIGDRCLLYYNQPLRYPNFLAVKYIVSCRGTSLATLRRALLVLDEIARLKRTDALLGDVTNLRISDRFLRRWGWEPHTQSRWHRNFIKRFYENYDLPQPADAAPPANVTDEGCLTTG